MQDAMQVLGRFLGEIIWTEGGWVQGHVKSEFSVKEDTKR